MQERCAPNLKEYNVPRRDDTLPQCDTFNGRKRHEISSRQLVGHQFYKLEVGGLWNFLLTLKSPFEPPYTPSSLVHHDVVINNIEDELVMVEDPIEDQGRLISTINLL